MCRLLGYATSGDNQSLDDVLTSSQLETFQQMAIIHNDGWGAALVTDPPEPAGIYDGGAPTPSSNVSIYKSTSSAYADPVFRSIECQGARGGLYHLRLASSNLPLIMENQQPFFADGVSFIHNGDISDLNQRNIVRAPSKPVSELDMLRTGGKSDSAVYFALVLSYYHKGLELHDAAREAIADLRGLCPRSSYNCMIQTGDTYICVHAVGSLKPEKEIEELYARYGQAEHAADYRRIRYRELAGGGVVAASSGFEQRERDGWKTLPNNHMIIASNRTGEYRIEEL
ncbi:class II glutamine amidotransferase [Bifidobacterium sp. 82T24]|uniref:class II glutamine amidotransferase n=1 Tax=Bifidobacterium pluvialisilvae TaxID=2834436 RepID=UPI001C57C525|nr:class II glutamine amidotransferase [Bifidobacterium pluvialisilvae]MBW3087426.1 class II glutamine amidotransferase [Bifidobacterium pluvialisilvae]